MGSRSATELLQLPVRQHGIRLGRPVDVLLAPDEWRVLGFVVLCGDENERFLAYAAVGLRDDEIAVASALLLLEDVEFYRARTRSLRALLGTAIVSDEWEPGTLRDALVAPDGLVVSLVLEDDDTVREVASAGAAVESEQVSAP